MRGYAHLLEATHAVQDVELLPPLGEVDFAVDEVGVAQVNEGQVLQDQTPGARVVSVRVDVLFS